eukprot:TRINITY_DN4006_c0_g4_i1.p1 TRINITY_DN4006_c0_g4~~TRINITY_DN4006_c0_g4_i1.p1  ORF type:complete len:125 (+),score=50.37 TRINITY_DN4006_c0_g4_i1:133-507(+)
MRELNRFVINNLVPLTEFLDKLAQGDRDGNGEEEEEDDSLPNTKLEPSQVKEAAQVLRIYLRQNFQEISERAQQPPDEEQDVDFGLHYSTMGSMRARSQTTATGKRRSMSAERLPTSSSLLGKH